MHLSTVGKGLGLLKVPSPGIKWFCDAFGFYNYKFVVLKVTEKWLKIQAMYII